MAAGVAKILSVVTLFVNLTAALLYILENYVQWAESAVKMVIFKHSSIFLSFLFHLDIRKVHFRQPYLLVLGDVSKFS